MGGIQESGGMGETPGEGEQMPSEEFGEFVQAERSFHGTVNPGSRSTPGGPQIQSEADGMNPTHPH